MRIRRIGVVPLPSRGHLNPSTCLGRRLQRRGYEIVVFGLHITRAIIERARLRFWPIDSTASHSVSIAATGVQRLGRRNTINAIRSYMQRSFVHLPDALRSAKVDALVIDQGDLGAGSVAELLDLPFITLSLFPPFHLDDRVPPFIFDWCPTGQATDLERNRRGNQLCRHIFSPIMCLLNEQRQAWGLPPLADINDVSSRLAIVTQLPKVLDFPSLPHPPHIFYSGSFNDGSRGENIDFPWNRLDGRPVVYASLGTVRYDLPAVFRIIAEACSLFNVQLVISLGGMFLAPSQLGPLPGAPIVVHYAPQDELLRRADFMITHGGLNTTLDALSNGVPLTVIPITDDQPGVAARVRYHRVGSVVPVANISVEQLSQAVETIVSSTVCRSAAADMGAAIRRINGLEIACDVIEQTFDSL